jgi:phosphatidylinositol glycan class F
VLFGAPLSLPASISTSPLTLATPSGGGATETFLFAAHLAVLAGQPLVYARGVDAEAFRRAGALALPLDDVMGGAVGALLGAWFGAVPIPLDW